MTDGAASRPSGRRRLVTVLKFVFAGALLAFVATLVPWSDVLTWQRGEQAFEIPGELAGDWKEDEIEFAIAEDYARPAEADVALPAELVAGAVVTITRAAGPDPAVGAFDWRPSMPRVFGELEPSGLVLALLSFLCAVSTVITRWWRLLAVANCHTTWFNAARLTFLGLFFNIVFPGLTGGDLVKAVLVVRENPGRRADALMSVFVDRVIGLLALAGLAAVMLLFLGDEFAQLRLPVIGFVVLGVAGGVIYTHRGLRRLVRFDALIAKLPMAERIRKLDTALLVYSRRPGELVGAVALSIVNHLFFATAVFSLGRAFGDLQPFSNYLAIVPVANIVSSIPVAPGGWGVGEAMFRSLFLLVGADPTIGVAVSITQRLCVTAVGLAGGLFLLMPGGKVNLHEIQEMEPQN